MNCFSFSFEKKKMQIKQLEILIIDGLVADLFTLSCHQSLIFVKLAADNTKWGNIFNANRLVDDSYI